MGNYIFVYKTTNLVNNKLYIGVHQTNDLNDGYIGCGVDKSRLKKKNTPFQRAVKKYGYHNFSTEIIRFFDTYSQALEFEAQLVTIDIVKDKRYYNACIGGGISPTTGVGHTEAAKSRMSKVRKGVYIVGEKNPKAKLNSNNVLDIKHLLKEGISNRKLATMFNISIFTIRDIKHKRTWMHI